jgi:hypothetical protein
MKLFVCTFIAFFYLVGNVLAADCNGELIPVGMIASAIECQSNGIYFEEYAKEQVCVQSKQNWYYNISLAHLENQTEVK